VREGKMKEIFKSINKMITEIPVSEIMVKNVISLDDEATAKEAIDLMSKHSISGVVVNGDNGKPVGILSEGDLFKKVFQKGRDPKKVKLKEIMHLGLETLPPTKNIGEASLFMKKHNISKIPIEHNGRIIGYVTKSDLLEKLNDIYYQNRQFIWLTVIVMVQFLVIAILITAMLKR
jgi:CBS domain-containing protein